MSTFLDSNFVVFGIWNPVMNLEAKKFKLCNSDDFFEIYAQNHPRVQKMKEKDIHEPPNNNFEIDV